MPVVPCPNCKASTSSELSAPESAIVNYFRCRACGHTWTACKQTNKTVEHVTPLDKAPEWFDLPPHDD